MSLTHPAESRFNASAIGQFWSLIERLISRSVPVITGRTLAVARIIFGCFLLFCWLTYDPDSLSKLSLDGPLYAGTKTADLFNIFSSISASSNLRSVLYLANITLILAFVFGIYSRFLYPALVASLWASAFCMNVGHFLTPLLLALTATLGSPWSDRWSFDSRNRTRVLPDLASRAYGFPIWLLGLTIGLAYAAAGLSKLIITDGGWLIETGARSGLIQDFRFAVVDWGMLIANSYKFSLLASFLSGIGQIIYLYSSFTNNTKVKYSICFLIALPFLFGLMLLMGLFWWPWVILVVMLYLPWVWLDKKLNTDSVLVTDGPSDDRVCRRYVVTAIGLIALHLYAVVSVKEIEPFFSHYPMYASSMRADSHTEKQFWEKFKTYGRNYQNFVEVVSHDRDRKSVTRQDLSLAYRAAAVVRKALPSLNFIGIDANRIWGQHAAGNLSPELCTDISRFLENYAEAAGTHSATLRLGRRPVELADGVFAWAAETNWIEIDAREPNCQIRAS